MPLQEMIALGLVLVIGGFYGRHYVRSHREHAWPSNVIRLEPHLRKRIYKNAENRTGQLVHWT